MATHSVDQPGRLNLPSRATQGVRTFVPAWILTFALISLLGSTGCKSEQKPASEGSTNAATTGEAAKPDVSAATNVEEPESNPGSTAADDASAPGSRPDAGPSEAPEADAETPPDDDDVAEPPGPEPTGRLLPEGDFGPIPEAAKAIFMSSEEDPSPESLDAVKEEHEGKHFLFSDEYHPEKYKELIENLGGAYVGIGTDQAYIFMGWQRPVIAFLPDYDPWVKLMHLAYAAFFHAAETPDAFINFFEDAKAGRKVIREFYADDPRGKDIEYVFRKAAHKGRWRHLRIRNAMRKADIPTYLNDQETYDYVRTMVMNGRTRPMMGNLLADKGFVGIGEVAEKLGVPVRVLYISNAEQYWDYDDQYRKNMFAMPIDDKTVVLHTLATKPWNEDYQYAAHSGENFFAWLRSPSTTNVRSIIPRVEIEGPEDIPLTIVEELPKDAPPAE